MADAPVATPVAGTSPSASGEARRPTVIVDDLSVIYRVLVGGSGRGHAATGEADKKPAEKPGLVRRLTERRRLTARRIREVKAVRGVSFTVNHGDVLGLIGSNGSGKSTLLRAIAGLVPATAGSVHASSEPTLLGVNAALVGDLSGERNILLGGLAMGMSRREIESRVDEIADLAGLTDFIDMPMKTYSSGMAARLRFAIAASAAPDILLIDEALATGDAAFRKKSEGKIRELKESAASVLIVSHTMSDVESNCNRAIWLDQGVIRLDGDVAPVLKAYQDSVK